MKVNQIASVLNATIMKEITGTEIVVAEDLRNIVDAGKQVLDFVNTTGDINSFVSTLIDQIGRVKFVDRTYRSQAPNIVHDSWEYGSILMKVRAEVPDFQENTSWKLGALDGKGIAEASELDPFVISAPTAEAKFYNSKVTYEAPITIGEIQLRQAFSSASEMGRFIATIENRIQMKMTLSTDALVMRTINNLIALKIQKDSGGVINLLTEFNSSLPQGQTALTAAQALKNTEFLRFATKTIALYKEYLKTAGSLYNDGNYITFTPEENLKFVALSEFAKDMETYLYADTYHNEFVKMEGYSTVPFWQGTGTGENDFEERSKIIATPAGGTGTAVTQTGVVAVMFDEQAAAVCNENYRVTSQYNARGEYTNYFYKWDAMYMNDIEENCLVFLVADKT